jgi:hypothetical protein
MKSLVILGTRGIPAKHGGFETFAEKLCLFLAEKDWVVTVYCQEAGLGDVYETTWRGVNRIHITVKRSGPIGTVIFDLKSVWLAHKNDSLHLTLGYNMACFKCLQRLYGITNVINMDGIEWKRQKWGLVARSWFWLNERFGCYFVTHLIADYPRIEDHLATRVSRSKITMIPYGGLDIQEADESLITCYGVTKNMYSILMARPEPENSILEVVQAFCATPRTNKLQVLAKFMPESNPYHQKVIEAANDDVIFPGAIYDAESIAALRLYSRSSGWRNQSFIGGGVGCGLRSYCS